MIRVGLLDTTIPQTFGSMTRYRHQLVDAINASDDGSVDVTTEFLGCNDSILFRTPARLRMWRRHLETWKAARALDTSRYDLVHLLDGSFGYVINAIKTPRAIATVHDVIPRLQMDKVFPGAPRVGFGANVVIRGSLRGVARADAICADSESTSADLCRYGISQERIRVVPLAIEPELFCNAGSDENQPACDAPYILHLGNNGFYKNRRGAIEVFNQIDPDLGIHLVLAGPEPDADLCDHARMSRHAERIHFVENPMESELADLYGRASVFLFPSRYEGFGWPPLEAMSARCPVVASDAGSLPEVVGDAGVVIASGDYAEMANACVRIVRDEAYRDQLIDAGLNRVLQFSQQRLAERMSQLYHSVVSNPKADSS